MCQQCIDKVKRGFSTKIENCPEHTGLPMNGTCLDCDTPIFAHILKSGKLKYKNRDGEPHSRTCASFPKGYRTSGKYDYGVHKGKRSRGIGLDE